MSSAVYIKTEFSNRQKAVEFYLTYFHSNMDAIEAKFTFWSTYLGLVLLLLLIGITVRAMKKFGFRSSDGAMTALQWQLAKLLWQPTLVYSGVAFEPDKHLTWTDSGLAGWPW